MRLSETWIPQTGSSVVACRKCVSGHEFKARIGYRIGFNTGTGANIDDLLEKLQPALAQMPQGGPPDPATELAAGPRWSGADIEARVRPLLDCRIREEIEPFLRAMQRRLARDCDRVHAYHDAGSIERPPSGLPGSPGPRASGRRRTAEA